MKNVKTLPPLQALAPETQGKSMRVVFILKSALRWLSTLPMLGVEQMGPEARSALVILALKGEPTEQTHITVAEFSAVIRSHTHLLRDVGCCL